MRIPSIITLGSKDFLLSLRNIFLLVALNLWSDESHHFFLVQSKDRNIPQPFVHISTTCINKLYILALDKIKAMAVNLQDYNIVKSAEQMESLTERGAKIVLTAGINQAGQMFVAHNPDIDKDMLIKMLQGVVQGMIQNGVRTTIENGPAVRPKVFLG